MKKRILTVVAVLVGLFVIFYAFSSLRLSDKDINGFVGCVGIVRSTLSNSSGVKLTDQPLQYMVKQDSDGTAIQNFLKNYADNHESSGWNGWTGRLTKGGKNYQYNVRAFTKQFCIVKIENF